MKGKKILISILLLIVITSSVYAQEAIIDSSTHSWWDDFQHQLSDLGLFTAQGQSRQCSINPDYEIQNPFGGTPLYVDDLLGDAGCNADSALLDIFYAEGNDYYAHFYGEYRSEDFGSFSFDGNKVYTTQVYCCPYHPCDSTSDCSSPPASNYGNTCNIQYGSCYSSSNAHSTKVYQCINNNWDYQYTVSFGGNHWCSSSSNNNYIDQSGNEHCASSPNSAWCDIDNGGNNGGNDNGGGTGDNNVGSSLTWSKFYSMTDEDYAKGDFYCLQNSDCSSIEGYTVKCSNEDILIKRLQNYYKKSCDESSGYWDELISGITHIIPGLGKFDFCGTYGEFKTKFLEENGGVCIAEPNKWYLKIWDSTLKVVGGLGLPPQYGVIIAIILIMTLLSLGVKLIK